MSQEPRLYSQASLIFLLHVHMFTLITWVWLHDFDHSITCNFFSSVREITRFYYFLSKLSFSLKCDRAVFQHLILAIIESWSLLKAPAWCYASRISAPWIYVNLARIIELPTKIFGIGQQNMVVFGIRTQGEKALVVRYERDTLEYTHHTVPYECRDTSSTLKPNLQIFDVPRKCQSECAY